MNDINQKVGFVDMDGSGDIEKEGSTEKIVELGSTSVENSKGRIHCLTIIGQIEGHILLPPQNKTTKYEHVIPQLVEIEEDEKIDGLLIILNTVGGDVEAGLALSEMIASMKKPTVSLVLGGGHSIGVPLAVAAKYSLIAPSAAMTLHPIRMNGTVIGVPQSFDYMNRIQDRVVQFVTLNSKISREKFFEYITNTGELTNDVGSILFGNEAVDAGLIDKIGGVSDALEELYKMVAERKKEKETL